MASNPDGVLLCQAASGISKPKFLLITAARNSIGIAGYEMP